MGDKLTQHLSLRWKECTIPGAEKKRKKKKDGRCQMCSLALQIIVKQMAKLNDQDLECVEVSAFTFVFLLAVYVLID